MGLIPHALQGAKVVCVFAVVGSKLIGTGLEKLHIVQTHVAVLATCGDGDDLAGVSFSCALFRVGDADVERPRERRAERFNGLGKRVILADDFKKPA